MNILFFVLAGLAVLVAVVFFLFFYEGLKEKSKLLMLVMGGFGMFFLVLAGLFVSAGKNWVSRLP